MDTGTGRSQGVPRSTMPADGFVWSAEAWGPALRSMPLEAVADHFFTTRQLRLRGDGEDADWARVAEAIGLAPDRLIHAKQVHGNGVVVARRGGPHPARSGGRPQADILISDDPEVAVVVEVADCVPLLMADRRTGAVAAVHAGWRGTLAAAAPAAVAAMAAAFGTRPDDLVVAHGPSIGPCCYAVGEELIEAFRAGGHGRWIERWFSANERRDLTLDLWAANRDQLAGAGVPAEAIHLSGLCTASHAELFHSFRRDGPGTGRIAAVIRSRPPGPSPRWRADRLRR
jgi:polyphenol oxidase